MLEYLNSYEGKLTINEVTYPSVAEARAALSGFKGNIRILLNHNEVKQSTASHTKEISSSDEGTNIYQIKVRTYMTKPSSPDFDFQDKWNHGVPMPLRIMVGKKLKETRGMVQMELWGEITQKITSTCMKCGRPLTNPVSRYFGIGPECGGHNYVNPFESDEELNEAVEQMKTELKNIRWTGWIIKSAIEEETILRTE